MHDEMIYPTRVEHSKRIVEEWQITITEDPMDLESFATVFAEASHAGRRCPLVQRSVHFQDPDSLILRVQYPADED